MPAKTIDLTDIQRILRETAGVEARTDLDGDILDQSFDELGYDSIALLETTARITREYGISIEDDAVFEATTLRKLLALVSSS